MGGGLVVSEILDVQGFNPTDGDVSHYMPQ